MEDWNSEIDRLKMELNDDIQNFENLFEEEEQAHVEAVQKTNELLEKVNLTWKDRILKLQEQPETEAKIDKITEAFNYGLSSANDVLDLFGDFTVTQIESLEQRNAYQLLVNEALPTKFEEKRLQQQLQLHSYAPKYKEHFHKWIAECRKCKEELNLLIKNFEPFRDEAYNEMYDHAINDVNKLLIKEINHWHKIISNVFKTEVVPDNVFLEVIHNAADCFHELIAFTDEFFKNQTKSNLEKTAYLGKLAALENDMSLDLPN